MIPRPLRAVPFAFSIATTALLAGACDKVPLLAPSGSTITLTSAATTLPLGGSTQILAQVLEAGGTPPQDGTLITFTTTLGSIQPPEAETRGGRVTVTFHAGTQNGTATIVASSGGSSASGNNAIRIALGSAAVGRVTIDANPTTVSSNGGTSTITTVVFDINGNPLPGVPVSFSTDAGTVSPSVVTADANGAAVATLTTTRTAKVTATAGITGGGTGTGTGTGGTGGTASSTQTATITVTVNPGPSVAITSSTTTPVAGQPVSFTVTPTVPSGGNPIARMRVDFGDGSAPVPLGSSTSSVAHTFISPGTYTVTATATDVSGDQGTGTLILTVGNRPPANVTISANPANPQAGQPTVLTITTTFPAGNTGLVQSVTVSFGDGTPDVTLGAQATATVQHAWASPGTYIVTATVRDTNGGTNIGSTPIIVVPKPQAAVALSTTPNPSTVNQPVTFTATVSQLPSGVTVDHFEWTFGDGSPVRSTTSNTTSKIYTAPANYTASVTAVMSDGSRSTSTTEQRVN